MCVGVSAWYPPLLCLLGSWNALETFCHAKCSRMNVNNLLVSWFFCCGSPDTGFETSLVDIISELVFESGSTLCPGRVLQAFFLIHCVWVSRCQGSHLEHVFCSLHGKSRALRVKTCPYWPCCSLHCQWVMDTGGFVLCYNMDATGLCPQAEKLMCTVSMSMYQKILLSWEGNPLFLNMLVVVVVVVVFVFSSTLITPQLLKQYGWKPFIVFRTALSRGVI